MFAHDNIQHPSTKSAMDSLSESTDLSVSAARPAEANTGQASTSTSEIEDFSGDDCDSEIDAFWSAFLRARNIHESVDQEQELLDEKFIEAQTEPEFITITLNRNQDDFHSEASDAACDSNTVIADLVYRRTVTNGAVSEEWLRHRDICLEFLDKDTEDGSTEYFVARVDKDQVTKPQAQRHILGKL